jgi:hypothetical protein
MLLNGAELYIYVPLNGPAKVRNTESNNGIISKELIGRDMKEAIAV